MNRFLGQAGGTFHGQAETAGAERGAATQASTYDIQRRYDLAYIQCMYATGHRVPVLGCMTVRPASASGSPPRPTDSNPPPSVPHGRNLGNAE